jgi:hypothetical protein
MAKIYEWTYKSDKGQIIADNLKDAKKQIATKFGNAIKIPKGTKIKKVGLSKSKPSTKIKNVEEPLKKMLVDSLPNGTVLNGPKGATYKIGQRGKKPVWYNAAILEHQGVKSVTVAATKSTDTAEVYAGYELKNCIVLNKKSIVSGPVSMVYEVDGNRTCCYMSEDSSMILPPKAKIWKLGGEWSIV